MTLVEFNPNNNRQNETLFKSWTVIQAVDVDGGALEMNIKHRSLSAFNAVLVNKCCK